MKNKVDGFPYNIELRNFPLPVLRFELEEINDTYADSRELRFTFVVGATDSRDPSKTFNPARVTFFPLSEDMEFVRDEIYSTIRELMVHELDEAWHVDGIRTHEPHP